MSSPSPNGASLIEHLAIISDPRSSKSRLHPLISIIVTAVCAAICGADTWVEVEEWGRAKEKWLSKLIDLPNGIPSHDTFGRVFAILNPSEVQEAFLNWTAGVAQALDGEVVAIDGKTLRRSFSRGGKRGAIHVVSAWTSAFGGMVLGQVKTEEKSNEITAIPALLKLLELKGCIVTIDAMGCQKDITETIVEGGGDYLIAVKRNQPRLYRYIVDCFDDAHDNGFVGVPHDVTTQTESGHGRREERTAWVMEAPEDLPDRHEWAGVQSIVVVEAVRTAEGKTSTSHRFYIGSVEPGDADMKLDKIRAHWGIENSLHWVLDTAFREDEARHRIGHSAENMARLRHMSLNLLRQEKTAKVGVKIKRRKAGWDNDYLLRVLGIGA